MVNQGRWWCLPVDQSIFGDFRWFSEPAVARSLPCPKPHDSIHAPFRKHRGSSQMSPLFANCGCRTWGKTTMEKSPDSGAFYAKYGNPQRDGKVIYHNYKTISWFCFFRIGYFFSIVLGLAKNIQHHPTHPVCQGALCEHQPVVRPMWVEGVPGRTQLLSGPSIVWKTYGKMMERDGRYLWKIMSKTGEKKQWAGHFFHRKT